MKEDYRMEEQAKNFAILEERIRQYLEKPSIKDNQSLQLKRAVIQESLQQIKDAIEQCIVCELNWCRQIELANHAIETDNITELKFLMESLASYCGGPNE